MAPRSALLLVQLGTPDAPTAPAVRRYLEEFLADPRVVDYPRWLWFPILHGLVLRLRPPRAAEMYRRIWSDEGSPLLVNSRRLQAALAEELGPSWRVELGMRYGSPSLPSAISSLSQDAEQQLVVLPLFPQYSRATTESVYDALDPLIEARFGRVTRIRSFASRSCYVGALAETARQAQSDHGAPQRWLLSFHGLPRRYVRAGDPYPQECATTARLLAEEMNWDPGSWELCYQSRFGPEPWIGPNTQDRLRKLGKEGVKRLYVMTPSFSADCLETLDEIGLRGAEIFRSAGGGELRLIPCLNARLSFVRCLAELAKEASVGSTGD